jgi:hypothetical protein
MEEILPGLARLLVGSGLRNWSGGSQAAGLPAVFVIIAIIGFWL